MGRKGVVVLLILVLTMSGTIHSTGGISIKKIFSEEIVKIDGVSELQNSTVFFGGSGKTTDPYIIEGENSSQIGLVVSNIPGTLIIRNFEFMTSTNYSALKISDITHCCMENITIKNHPHLIMASGDTNLKILNSTFEDIPTGYQYIENSFIFPIGITIIGELRITNSTFKGVQNQTQSSSYKLLSSSKIEIQNCRFDNAVIGIRSVGGIIDIGNCTFNDLSIFEMSDYGTPPISYKAQDNIFDNSSLWIGQVNGASIIQNRFEGLYSELLIGLSYPVYSYVQNNTFFKSKGLSNYYGNYGDINYYYITENKFTYCNNGAMRFGRYGASDLRIWKNLFRYNSNSGVNFTIPQVSISNTQHSGYHDVNWSKDGIGNYWSDWKKPDINNDGFVDDPYPINTNENIYDPYPITNPQFDITRPTIRITEPIISDPIDQEYIRIKWVSSDVGSDIRSEWIGNDNTTWINVTDQNWWSLRLSTGENAIHMKVMDNAGLYNFTSETIRVGVINGPLRIKKPLRNSYLKDGNISIEWRIEENFPIEKQSVIIDGDQEEISNGVRGKNISLDEGSHTVLVQIMDQKGCEIDDRIMFDIDTTPPEISVTSPLSEIHYSNNLVRFRWKAMDKYPLKNSRYRIDGDPWIDQIEDHIGIRDILLSPGTHRFEVEAEDLAGWKCSKVIEFTVGSGNLANFIKPLNGSIIKVDNVLLEWEFTGDMPINASYLISGGSITNVTNRNSKKVDLKNEGSNEFIIRYYDLYGNYFQDSIVIIKDTTSPILEILNRTEYVNLNPMKFFWYSWDLNGIEEIRYRLDNTKWNVIINHGELSLLDITEGEHLVEFMSIDMAGNKKIDSYIFTYDITLPEVFIDEPENNSVSGDAVQNVYWNIIETNPIQSLAIDLDNRTKYLNPDSTNTIVDLKSGLNKISLIVVDVAGNIGKTQINLNIDLEKPILEWINQPDSLVNTSDLKLEWNATDNSRIEELFIIINEEIIELNPWTSCQNVSLDEGENRIEIHVIDVVGLTRSIETIVIVDLSPPVINILTATRTNQKISLTWDVFDSISGINNITIKYAGKELYLDSIKGNEIINYNPGDDSIQVSIMDNAKNEVIKIVNVSLSQGQNVVEKERSNSVIVLLYIALTFTILLTLFLFLFFQKKKKEMKQKISENEEALPSPSIEMNGNLEEEKWKRPPIGLNQAIKLPELPARENDSTPVERKKYDLSNIKNNPIETENFHK